MLKEYHKKRNFKRTSEPKGRRKNADVVSIFVIQEHYASHLHYDFRLEMEGVLKSWAVPKGIPIASRQKHLAVETEDHPLEYADFEGTIPEGEYGGGTVKIWDKGFYENITLDKNQKLKPIYKAFKEGHIVIRLQGRRLKEKCFALHKFGETDKKNWLLIKVKDK